MTTARMLAKLADLGLSPQQMAGVARVLEEEAAEHVTAIERRRAADSRRQREKRERDCHVTSRDVTVTKRDTPFPSFLSPTPPILSTKPQEPPIIPQKPVKSVVAVATESEFELAWKACTEPMRKRAGSKTATLAEWRKACRSNSPAELLTSVRKYLAHDPDVGRTGGPSFQRWLRDRKFEAWLTGADLPAEPVTPALLANRRQRYADTGEWSESWGPRPEERAA
jgi:hypothetical protein